MAVSLATGIVFASVIILVLVPALLMVREDITGWRSKDVDLIVGQASSHPS